MEFKELTNDAEKTLSSLESEIIFKNKLLLWLHNSHNVSNPPLFTKRQSKRIVGAKSGIKEKKNVSNKACTLINIRELIEEKIIKISKKTKGNNLFKVFIIIDYVNN